MSHQVSCLICRLSHTVKIYSVFRLIGDRITFRSEVKDGADKTLHRCHSKSLASVYSVSPFRYQILLCDMWLVQYSSAQKTRVNQEGYVLRLIQKHCLGNRNSRCSVRTFHQWFLVSASRFGTYTLKAQPLCPRLAPLMIISLLYSPSCNNSAC